MSEQELSYLPSVHNAGDFVIQAGFVLKHSEANLLFGRI
jgi:hypothetical protein